MSKRPICSPSVPDATASLSAPEPADMLPDALDADLGSDGADLGVLRAL